MNDTEEILNWYLLAGVDETTADEPLNVLKTPSDTRHAADADAPAQKISDGAAAAVRPATTLLAQENNAACINAEKKCQDASNLEELRLITENFEGCALRFSANSTVFGNGDPHAKLMLIGEAPGADEDRQGKPFVGRSGQLLEKMLHAIGLNREDCYITNVLPWRPPGNRTPTDAEVAVCLPFLRRQIELVSPDVIFLLGASAANAVLGINDSISSLRGKVMNMDIKNKKITVLASFHPAYLLRSCAQKAKAWNDLLRLKHCLADIKS